MSGEQTQLHIMTCWEFFAVKSEIIWFQVSLNPALCFISLSMDDFFIPENDRNLHKTGASLNAILLSCPLQIYIGFIPIVCKHLFFRWNL